MLAGDVIALLEEGLHRIRVVLGKIRSAMSRFTSRSRLSQLTLRHVYSASISVIRLLMRCNDVGSAIVTALSCRAALAIRK